MRVVIAGGHGQIARHLERLLVSRGDQAVGLIRNPDHTGDLVATSAEPVVVDLEDTSVEEVAQQGNGSPDSDDVMDLYWWAKGQADVALVLAAVLDRDGLSGKTFELVGGSDEIDYALTGVA